MHLFTRQATLAPDHLQDGLAYAVEIAEYVSDKTGLEVVPWTALYGAPVGSVSWSARVPSQAAMGAAQDTLAADDGFLERSSASRHLFTGPAEDAIGQFLAFAGGSVTGGGFATIVISQCAGGNVADATAWGVDTMQYVSKLTGAESSIARGIYGPFATLVWVSRFDSLEAVDDADAVLSNDPQYLERLDGAGDLFLPGSTAQRLIRRLS
jgi:hypothetical protein